VSHVTHPPLEEPWATELTEWGLWPPLPDVEWPLYRHVSRVSLRGFQYLRNVGGCADAAALLRKSLNMRGRMPDGLEDVARALFGGTPGFREYDDGQWCLSLDAAALDALDNQKFVVFDLETTGGKPPEEQITEIGCVRLEDGEITAQFQSLVNPDKPIPPFVARLTGITNKMVRRAPRIEQVMPRFLDFIEGYILIAHDVFQDLRFIDQTLLTLYNGVLAQPVIDTLVLAKQQIDPEIGYSLRKVAEHLEIEAEGAHRALDDAIMTAQLFLRFQEDLREGEELLAGYRFEDDPSWRQRGNGLTGWWTV